MEVVHHAVRLRGKVTQRHNRPRFAGQVESATPDLTLQPRFSGIAGGNLATALIGSDALVYRRRVWVGGVEIPAADLVGSTVVEIQRRGLHQWAFAVRIRPDGTSAIGRITAGKCGLLRGRVVNISVDVMTSAGLMTKALIVGGVEHQSDEDRESATITVSGVGSCGLYDQAETGLLLDSGSLLPRGTMVRRALVEAGIPGATIQISGGAALTKGVDAAGERVFSLADDLLLPAVEAIHCDPTTGKITTASLGKLPGNARWTIGTGGLKLLAGSASMTGADASQGPTKITAKSTRQITDEDCSEETLRTVVTLEADFAVPRYVSKYDATGAIVTSGTTNAARFQRTGETITTVVKRCGEEYSRIIEEWAWYTGPEVFKARLNTDGTVASVNTNGYHYATAGSTTVGGSEIDRTPMRAWPVARWTLIRRTAETRVFSKSTNDAVNGGEVIALRKLADGEPGLLINKRTRLEEWHHIQAPLKTKSISSTIPWDEIGWIDQVKVFANGEGSLYGTEQFGRFVKEEFDLFGSPFDIFGGVDALDEIIYSKDGSTVLIEAEHRSWGPWNLNSGGSLFLFASGDVGTQADWIFAHHETVTTQYEATGEASHDVIASTNTIHTARSSTPLNRTTERGLSGALPATPKVVGAPGGERIVAAPPDQVQEIAHTIDLRLSACRHPRTETVQVYYAENEQELRLVAEHLARESVAATWSGSVRINPALSPTEPITISDAPFFTGTVHPVSIRHEIPAQGLPTSTVTGSVYA